MDVSTGGVGRTSIAYHKDYAAGESRALSTHVADVSVDGYTHDVMLLDGTSASVDATLPDVTAVPVGRQISFVAINIDNTVRLVSSDNISGSGTFTFSAANEAVSVTSNGTTWYLGNTPAAIADGSITPAKTERERVLTADTDGTVVAADKVIYISTTGAGSRTLTFGDTGVAGHRVTVVMTAQATGTYATVGIDSGEVTFSAANQQSEFVYNETADTWQQIKAEASDVAPNSVDSDAYVDGSIDLIHMSANSVDSDQYVDGSIDLIHMSADSVDSDQYVDGSIDTEHYADASITPVKLSSGYTALADGAALTLAITDRSYQLTNSASGAVAATMTAGNAGQKISFRMISGDGSNYYTLAVTGGTITMNAANEACGIVYSGSAWELDYLAGATFA